MSLILHCVSHTLKISMFFYHICLKKSKVLDIDRPLKFLPLILYTITRVLGVDIIVTQFKKSKSVSNFNILLFFFCQSRTFYIYLIEVSIPK